MLETALCFDDVSLVPQYSEILSRSDKKLNIGTEIGAFKYQLPIISSPMDSVYSPKMADIFYMHGGLCLIHRYNTIAEQIKEFENCFHHLNPNNIGCAIGMTGDYFDRFQRLWAAGCRVFCIDVAHGHHKFMKQALNEISKAFIKDHDPVFIIAGNVATYEGYRDLIEWGADAVRVGIGGGSICTTRIQTGHGVPTLQSIMDCAVAKKEHGGLLIACGGFRTTGDVIKGLAAGADMIVLGNMLAATSDSPGDIIEFDSVKYKAYRGMASKKAQFDWKGETKSLEGVSGYVKYTTTTEARLKEIEHQIRTGFSYSGVWSLKELHEKAKWTRQTGAGATEGRSHIIR